ncbi:MAG: hypothetical protein QNJ82_11435, partial [Gammaproteobacteria bacterium]|nr:hypothetical protein [Gammaproteobacteria bacterium]
LLLLPHQVVSWMCGRWKESIIVQAQKKSSIFSSLATRSTGYARSPLQHGCARDGLAGCAGSVSAGLCLTLLVVQV